MEINTFQIQIENAFFFPTGVEILIPRAVAHEHHIPNGMIMVCFGSKRTPALWDSHPSSRSTLYISHTLAKRLLFPFSATLHAHYSSANHELHLGPILGILISTVNPLSEELFGLYTSFCDEASEAAQQTGCFCYIMTLDHIAKGEGCAKGWIKKNGNWAESLLPLPHVIYNRLSNRFKERKGSTLQQINALKESGIAIFNEHFLNKWDVYQKLLQSDLSYYLPSTLLFKRPTVLKNMVSNFPTVFLKPVHGSEGKGIFRIRRTSTGYYVDQTKENGFDTLYYTTFTDMVKSLIVKLKKKAYVIQQGIPFIHWNGGPIDFRALLQKDQIGKWRIVSLIGRMGSPQTFVSNLAQGGSLDGATNILKMLKPTYPNLPISSQLKKTAIEIAAALDEQLDGLYGELGIDLGVDITGRIWLIEVNSKPSKKNDVVLESAKRPRPSVLHLFDYVKFLSGFN